MNPHGDDERERERERERETTSERGMLGATGWDSKPIKQ